MSRLVPPRLAEWVLRLILRTPDREYILGDLAQQYDERRAAGARARLWYWLQLFRALPAMARRFGAFGRLLQRENPGAGGPKLAEDVMQDLKYGLRMIWKNPVFSAVAILTLALGIGANTAIYTVVEAVLLEPLPFDDPDELTLLWTKNEELNQDKGGVSPMDFDDWRTMNATFESMAAFATGVGAGTVTEVDGNPTAVRVVLTTENFFDVMGSETLRGRLFDENDGPGSTEVALLSEGFWQLHYGGDPSIVGQAITLDGTPLEVIGIVRREHTFPVETDMWVNMTFTMQTESESREARWMSAIGRLSDGRELSAARADLVGVAARIEQANPGTNRGWSVSMANLQDEMVGDTRTALFILLGATGFVLLIACANVANLLLSRSTVRAHEIAVRVAFGAGRGRLVRQLVTESLVLAGAGALLGLALAQVGVRVLLALAPVTLPRSDTIGVDGTVLVVMAAVSLATGVLFGLAPIGRLLSSEVHTTIRDGSRFIAGASKQHIQNFFVVAQFAMALVLVVGAGLLVQSFSNIRQVDPGFAPEGVLTVELYIPVSIDPTNVRPLRDALREITDFYEEFERRIAGLPGVVAVGDASTLPLGEERDPKFQFQFVDREIPRELDPRVYIRSVSPGFFGAVRASVVSGRDFSMDDRNDAPGVVIINEAMAERFFPGEDPIGEKIGRMNHCRGPFGCVHVVARFAESDIVGVVRDMKYQDLRGDAAPAIYVSGLQSSLKLRTLAIRSTGATAPLLSAVRQELAALNPSVTITNIRTMDNFVADARSADRFSALLLTMFGVVALLLASVGVYGVLSYAIEQRKAEVGIRMALGADRGAVRGMVLNNGMKLVLIGLGVGVVGAILLSGLLSSQLFGVDPREPVIYALVTTTLLVIGLLASFVPAWRATRVDPVIAMRAE